MSSASMTAARALISGLPREELQNLAKEIQTLMTTAPKEKRVAAVGQKAWFAFMRHCRDTMAERFTTCKSAPDYAVVCKAIRQEDEAVYTAFVEKFKAENSAPASASDAEVSSAKPAPLAKPAAKSAEKEQKAAAKSAEKEQKSAEKAAEKAAKKEAVRLAKEGAHLAKEGAKEAAKQQKAADKEVAKQQKAAEKEAAKLAKAAAKPAKATKAKPAAKKATATAPISADATPALAEAEEDDMPKMTIAGTAYWHDESTNGLYSIDSAGGFGGWVGYYQPDNEEEPIRYTATPE